MYKLAVLQFLPLSLEHIKTSNNYPYNIKHARRIRPKTQGIDNQHTTADKIHTLIEGRRGLEIVKGVEQIREDEQYRTNPTECINK